MKKKLLVLMAALTIWASGSYVAWAFVNDWVWVSAPYGDEDHRNHLAGVSFTASDNGHAVGYYYDTTLSRSQTLAVKWNGSTWSLLTTPNPSTTGENKLFAVAAVNSTNIWAVGEYNNTDGEPLILYYNGTSWSQQTVSFPTSYASQSALLGIAAFSTSNVVAVGYYVPSGGSVA